MPYLYETHVHTSEVSTCGRVPAADVVRQYIAHGYSGLVLTDHFNRYTFEKLGGCSWDEKVDHFLGGYAIACETAAAEKPDFSVMLGLELRLDCDADNDFLVYGADEAFLRKSDGLMQMSFDRMTDYVHENGLLLVQAHPFRPHMCIVDWNKLDGVEVYNGNPHHQSNNPVADLWADRHGLLKTSGSYYHGDWGEHLGGIQTDIPVTDSRQFADILRNGPYTLIFKEEISK